MLRLEIEVIPSSTKNAIAGWQANRLRVSITPAFHNGAANVVTEKILATALGVSPKCVRIVRGLHGSAKSVVVDGVGPAAIQKLRVRRVAPGYPA